MKKWFFFIKIKKLFFYAKIWLNKLYFCIFQMILHLQPTRFIQKAIFGFGRAPETLRKHKNIKTKTNAKAQIPQVHLLALWKRRFTHPKKARFAWRCFWTHKWKFFQGCNSNQVSQTFWQLQPWEKKRNHVLETTLFFPTF